MNAQGNAAPAPLPDSGIFTISNFFSVLRIVLAWPIVVLLLEETPTSDAIAYALMWFGGITDFLDGYLARKYGQESNFGRIIDPVADKVLIGAIAIVLLVFRELPAWFLILIISRDLAILLLGSYMVRQMKAIPESNWYGKVAVTSITAVITAYTFDLDSWKTFTLVASTSLLLLSMGSYLKRFAEFQFGKPAGRGTDADTRGSGS